MGVTREIIHIKRQIACQRRQKRRNCEKIAELSRQLRNKLKTAKEKYHTHILSNFMVSSPHRFWRHLSQAENQPHSIIMNGTVLHDQGRIASHYNTFFQSVFSPRSCGDQSHNKKSGPHSSDMPDVKITYEGVVSLLLNINVKQSSGPDDIPNAFLRRYSEWIGHYLTIIFNASLEQKRVPDDWLVEKVVPIFKSGDRQKVENYRPISLSCVCCKLLEHVILKAIYTHLEGKKLLYSNQHGFRQNLSTGMQLVETIDDFARALNDKRQINCICLDMSKAFDRVPHSDLIDKLVYFGVNYNITQWIRAYLTGRTQYVDIDGSKSELLDVTSGVPRGSVLGPVLFLVYINDIAQNINKDIKVRLFADDCLLYKEINNENDSKILNDALKVVECWCETSKMKINKEKTVVFRVTNKRKHVIACTYTLGSSILATVNSLKYLGVTIACDISWKEHVKKIGSTAEIKLRFLRRKFKLASKDAKLTAYLYLVRPALEYASVVWDPCETGLINMLERVQRRAARFILSRYSRTHSVTEMLQLLNLPSLAE